MKTAQAALRLAELNLQWTKVRAPCDGRVSKQLIDPGNMVQADVTPLTTIVTLDPIYAYFNVDERTLLELRRMVIAKRGELRTVRQAKLPVLLGLADEKGYPHEGTIDFADNRLDVMTGTLRLRGVFPNPKRILSPGMFAKIRLPKGEPHQAILIPEAALELGPGTELRLRRGRQEHSGIPTRGGRGASRRPAGNQEWTVGERPDCSRGPATDPAGYRGPAKRRQADAERRQSKGVIAPRASPLSLWERSRG